MTPRMSHFAWTGIAGVPLPPSLHGMIEQFAARLQKAQNAGVTGLDTPEAAAAWIVAEAPELTIVVLPVKEVEALLALAVAAAQGSQAIAYERPT